MGFLPSGGGEVPPSGSLSSNICLIGEAPGAHELSEGRPFVGPAGRVLESCLHSAGLTRSSVYITNVVKEKPYKNNIGPYFHEKKGFTEKGMEWVARLKDELEQCKANVFVPMGNVALNALTELYGITTFRGYIVESTLLPGRKVIPTIHPAATLRGSYIARYYISHDFQKVKRQSEFPEIKYPTRNLITEMSFGEVIDWLKFMYDQPEIAWDIEVLHFEISCISFSHKPDIAISFPLGDAKWTVEEDVEIWKWVDKILTNPDIIKVGQNLIFDMQFMAYKYGIITKGHIKDTMIAHSLMYPDFLKGLGFLASIYTDQPYWKNMVHFKGGNIKKEA